MEKKVKEFLELSQDESEAVSRIVVPPQRPGTSSLYEVFALRGIRVDRVEPGLVVCTLKVPPRLTDELEITSKRLGQRGAYYGAVVLLGNKATGEIIAEGRHSMFRPRFTPKL